MILNARFFEKCLWKSRLLIVFAVISSVISAILMILLGSVAILWDIKHISTIFTSNETLEVAEKTLIINAISAMDTFLIATVLFIFGIGLYELFIRKIDMGKEAENTELVVHNLDQLKEKLIKVILIVLVVTFFKYAISINYQSIIELLYLSIAILLVAVSMFLTTFKIK